MTLETWMALWITFSMVIYAIWERWSNGRERRKRQELKRLAKIIRGREAMRNMK